MKKSKHDWPNEAKELAQKLHKKLSLSEENWHTLKTNSDRRAAELFAGALVQLLQEGELTNVEALINQGLLWLRREVKDPGCPK